MPFALFLAFNVNAARHLLVALLVPDKRGVGTAIAAIGICAYALSGGRISINSVLPLMTVALYGRVLWQMRAQANRMTTGTGNE